MSVLTNVPTCKCVQQGYPEQDCKWHVAPDGFPTLQEQAAYWERKEAEQERTGGENDFLEEQQQYSNYEGHEL